MTERSMSTEPGRADAVIRQRDLVDRKGTKEQPPKKHGIIVTEHKRWNTKEIFNNGHRMARYGHQPKIIRFHSPMVNDFNQHLCGGWSFADIPDDREATVQQLINGRKPFACIIYWPHQVAEAKDLQDRLNSSGLITELRSRTWRGWNTDHVWDLLACHDIRVRDIGDLELLRKDYAESLKMDLSTDMELYADMPLSTFFEGWGTPPLPLWLTGLILGYPVENTISFYMGQIR